MSNIKPCLDIEKLYSMDQEPTYDDMLDYIFEKVDNALYAGHDKQSWPDVETLLEEIDIERCSTQLLVGLLSITLPIRTNIIRQLFYTEVRKKFEKSESSKRIERLLGGLE